MTAEPIPIRRRSNWRAQINQAGPIEDFLDGFATHLRARHRSEATIYRYRLAAIQLSAFCHANGIPTEVTEIRAGDIEKFLAHSLETAAGSTAAGRGVALQQFFKYVARKLGEDKLEFTNPMDLVEIPTFEDPPVKPIPIDFLAALVKAVEKDPSYEGLRDAAIVRIFIDTGMRRDELAGITLSDIDGDEITILGKAHGSGKVERTVVIGKAAQKALRAYLRARRAHPYAESPMLWLGHKGAMTGNGIRQMVVRRSEKLGMRIYPHWFRHTWAHLLKCDDSVRDETIRKLAGWSPKSKMIDRYAGGAAGERSRDAYRRRGTIGDAL